MWEILRSWKTDSLGRKPSDKSQSSPQASRARSNPVVVNFKDLTLGNDHDEDEQGGVADLSVQPSSCLSSPKGPRLRLARNKLIIIMVGLPGRGKTWLCNKLVCYLNWLGHSTRLFNVGSYRRLQKGAEEVQDAKFFDKNNSQGLEARARALSAALCDLKAYLDGDEGQVAIFDATNTTNERRQYLVNEFHGKYQYLFIESICTDEKILEQNYRYKMKYSPDYKGVNEEQALRDFKERISKYEEVYEPITDRTRHYIKLIDMVTGRGYMDINRISGYIPGKIVFFLMQVCKAGISQERRIWLTRHGQSQFNLEGRIGGDSNLAPLGEEYAAALPEMLMDRLPVDSEGMMVPISVWTSTLRRTIQTAAELPFPKLRWKALDEIHAGSCDGLTYEQIAARYPDEFQARSTDKLRYRYPAGESYLDVIQRLEPVIIEIEREKECVMVVAHQAVLRAILGYFMAVPLEHIPTLDVPLHTLIELQPMPDGTMKVETIPIPLSKGTMQPVSLHGPAPIPVAIPVLTTPDDTDSAVAGMGSTTPILSSSPGAASVASSSLLATSPRNANGVLHGRPSSLHKRQSSGAYGVVPYGAVAETGTGSVASTSSGRDAGSTSPGAGSALGRAGSAQTGGLPAASVNGSSHMTVSIGPAALLTSHSSAAAGSPGVGMELLSSSSLEAGVPLQGSLSGGIPGEPVLSLNVTKHIILDSMGSTPYASMPSTGAQTPQGLSNGGSAL